MCQSNKNVPKLEASMLLILQGNNLNPFFFYIFFRPEIGQIINLPFTYISNLFIYFTTSIFICFRIPFF